MKEFKILVVDDYPEHIKIITNILLSDNLKYQILAAANGNNALEIAKSWIPHLIIMDWDMPVMNGMEATVQLKQTESTKDIPIIIASGYHTDSLAIMEALEKGAIDFVRKPIDKIELIARVHSMLRLVQSHLEVIRQKEINFEQEIAFKANQLNVHALTIAKQNEFLLFLINSLKRLKEISNSQSKKLIYDLIECTNSQLRDNAWENFEQQFDKVYHEFYNALGIKYPALTATERKLCLLLRMNLSSKEIANLTFQEPSSVDVARYRLRQKLDLDKDDNLVAFIMNLG